MAKVHFIGAGQMAEAIIRASLSSTTVVSLIAGVTLEKLASLL